jgi:hypothetical protein
MPRPMTILAAEHQPNRVLPMRHVTVGVARSAGLATPLIAVSQLYPLGLGGPRKHTHGVS